MAFAAAAGAAVVAAASAGDVTVLTAALCLSQLGRRSGVWPAAAAGVACGLAGFATLLRWRSVSLTDLAGAQAVLGPAGWVGPAPAAASSWCAAAAIVLACPAGTGVLGVARAVAFGLAAAALVAGPGPVVGLGLRVVASAVAVGATLVSQRVLPRRAGAGAALAAGCAAVLAAVA